MAEEKPEKDNKNKEADEPAPEENEGAEVAQLKDRILRMAAEFDNYKKRVAKDIDNSKALGRAEAIAKLLPTLDEFELAMEAFGTKDKDDEHMRGIALVYSNLLSALRGIGLREITSDGKFDPYRHEIVLVQESEEQDGSIIRVVRKGYMLGEIMLRPASVIVSRKGATNNTEKEKKGE